jgi:hypothetical protein
VSELVWQEHERWLDRHARMIVARERWTGTDWSAARKLADAAWDARPAVGLYIYAAEEALRARHYERVAARLGAEARLDVAWLLGVLEATR